MTLPILLLFAVGACDAEAVLPGRDAPVYAPDTKSYPFLSEPPALVRLDSAFPPPDGFDRIAVPPRSFGQWLRGLPLLRDRVEVLSYRGAELTSPSAGVAAIDVGTKDLQQCADSVIRLHAEYLWSSGRSHTLAYHFTSGDEVRYDDWVQGERIRAVGSRVTRLRGAARPDDHHSMRTWLDLVFTYAGTRSLSFDSHAVSPSDVRPGDFYVAPGSPGHAVMVLDVAEDSEGNRLALLGQGFMPAQEFHVLRSSGDHVVNGTWFVLPVAEEDELRTPSWKPFYGADARRFKAN